MWRREDADDEAYLGLAFDNSRWSPLVRMGVVDEVIKPSIVEDFGMTMGGGGDRAV